MKRSIHYIVISAILVLAAVMALSGCKKDTVNNSPISGGTLDKTDPNAPKTIDSKDITDMFVTFYLGEDSEEDYSEGSYSFSIRKNSSGVLMISSNELGLNLEADDSLLKALQDIIDEEDLAKKNGYYRVTAGLPPEFQACTLTVSYASGEKLTFTENNDPYAAWTKKMYAVITDWAEEK